MHRRQTSRYTFSYIGSSCSRSASHEQCVHKHSSHRGCTCRLKRFAVSAFMIIATVRGFLLNFGVYSATRAALGLSFKWSPAIL